MSLHQSNAGEQISPAPEVTPSNGPPPAYMENDPNADDTRLIASLRELHFERPGLQGSVNPMSVGPVTTDQCIAHLKLLAALADLRDTISATDGLFDLHDIEYGKYPTEEDRLKAAQLIREKRWAVYVGRAVDRFSTWHEKCIRRDGFGSNMGAVTMSDIERHGGLSTSVDWNDTIIWTVDMMPPLDVLMVWHAYMLNPRDFLEDCIRLAANFNLQTGLQWDSNHDSPSKTLSCPQCYTQVIVPWQIEPQIESLHSPYESRGGFGDKNFSATCYICEVTITHEKLRVAKFRHDVMQLISRGVPMPGTILNSQGMPKDATDGYRGASFPNSLIKLENFRSLLRSVDLRKNPSASISKVRDFLGESLQGEGQIHELLGGPGSKPDTEERIATRKMMSRYWDNSSPFALDLVGAVIRQGTFIGKMDNIDWIHSPTLESTVNRLITKYIYFFRIMSENPMEMAVPTLDVDLAWHTHQLSPYQYFTYSILHAKDRFINHDDKVPETKLTTAFQWTSKQYQKITNGEIYSECTCWYCEAIRESHNGRFFKSFATTQAQKRGDQLHSRSDINPDPLKSPHISTHSAVNPPDEPSSRVDARQVAALKLKSKYEKAMRRIRKRGSKSVLTRGGGDSAAKRLSLPSGTDNTKRDPYAATAIVWGLPVALALYIPFAVDPCINTHLYPCNPSCMSMGLDGTGNCIASTCTAEVAAGGCGWAADSGGAAAAQVDVVDVVENRAQAAFGPWLAYILSLVVSVRCHCVKLLWRPVTDSSIFSFCV
ncbi:hypothetical protein ACJ72_05311 [Emergomyces africanus]|uniref:Uncharacterized protein n=1 Tax=Emergomyces africanus TaxID=1955775 RepID=A0A1B7NUA5_9EURO|nr:hypothetical protein ACJ72_05311 [Emergomyces africanus]